MYNTFDYYDLADLLSEHEADSEAILKIAIDSLDEDELLELHNEIYDDDYESKIYTMDMFNELLEGCTPEEVLDSVAAGFNTNHNYIHWNGYGHLESSYSATNWIYPFDLLRHIQKSGDLPECFKHFTFDEDDFSDYIEDGEEE